MRYLDSLDSVIEGLFILLILLTLTSCNGVPPKRNIIVERCFPLMEKVIQTEDGEDLFKGVCQCHAYKVGDEIKRVSESVSKPLNYCHGEAVFKNYPTTLYLFLKEWSVYLLQQ